MSATTAGEGASGAVGGGLPAPQEVFCSAYVIRVQDAPLEAAEEARRDLERARAALHAWKEGLRQTPFDTLIGTLPGEGQSQYFPEEGRIQDLILRYTVDTPELPLPRRQNRFSAVIDDWNKLMAKMARKLPICTARRVLLHAQEAYRSDKETLLGRESTRAGAALLLAVLAQIKTNLTFDNLGVDEANPVVTPKCSEICKEALQALDSVYTVPQHKTGVRDVLLGNLRHRLCAIVPSGWALPSGGIQHDAQVPGLEKDCRKAIGTFVADGFAAGGGAGADTHPMAPPPHTHSPYCPDCSKRALFEGGGHQVDTASSGGHGL